MIFNQFEFLFLFLPAVVALFFMPALRNLRREILLVASLAFYGFSGIEHLVVLVTGIVWVYAATASPRTVGSRWRLLVAVSMPALALIYYKYTTFIIRDVLGLSAADGGETFNLFSNVVLPAGISFFTFQLVSFAIDRYRGEIKHFPAPQTLALYISFFPQLVAGPILRYHHVAATIDRLREYRARHEDIYVGTAFIVFGLAAKVLVADTLSRYIEPFTAAPGDLGVAASVYVVFAYSFQIYFDFYGYSLIAIGLGRLFGFSFPDNFLRPYEALNPKDFWRRWHTTLSYWLRDYLYVPLGGSGRYRRNILIVFTLCGLWHGAGWTFVVWGLFHAGLVAGYGMCRGAWDRMPKVVQISLNFTLVSLGWILFQFTFENAGIFVTSLVGMGANTAPAPSFEMWAALAVAFAVTYLIHFERAAWRVARTAVTATIYSAGLALLFSATLLFVDRSQDFIYFRF